MAESEEDKAVDTLIADIQAKLDQLKAAQKKDVDDEDGEPETPPKNLKEAERVAYTRVRAHNRRLRTAGTAAGTQSGKPDAAEAAEN